MNILALSALVVVLPVVSVVVADAWEARQFRGKFDCGCPWPAEDDGPVIVECACGIEHEFRPRKDWRGKVRDAWDPIEEETT